MKAVKITTDMTFEHIDKDWRALVELSSDADVACILCQEETPNEGYLTAYRNGRAEQYDPVTSRFI